MNNCYIQDIGLNILCRGLRHSNNITINQLDLNYTEQATQCSLISELTIRCKVRELVICHNHAIGENQELYSILTDPSNVLELLDMFCTMLSSSGAIALFTALRKNTKLKVLYVEDNDITDDALDAITTTLQSNSCLVELGMYNNPLSTEAIINIVQCLEANNTLQLLGLPYCHESVQENIISLQEDVNEKRKNQGCPEKLKITFYDILNS